MAQPNTALRAVRMSLRMSQDDFARAVRGAGQHVGRPNDASKRLVQRWEAGLIVTPRPAYARALEHVTGLPIAALGFGAPGFHEQAAEQAAEDGNGGHDVALTAAGIAEQLGARGSTAPGNYSGVWLSRYEYFSSSRAATFTGRHYVILLQHGTQLTVRSLPESAVSALSMDLTLDGNVVTGVWTERTDKDGYYRGARYHGAIQLLVEPSGRRMVGKWVGFGSDMEVNTGPWELLFQQASTSKATLTAYNRRPTEG